MDPPSATPYISSNDDPYAEAFKEAAGDQPLPSAEQGRLDARLMVDPSFGEPSGDHSLPTAEEARFNALLLGDSPSMNDPTDHSLPTAEEARLNALIEGRSNPYSGRTKRLMFLMVVSVVALAAIIGFSIAIEKKNSVRGSSASSGVSGSDSDSEANSDSSPLERVKRLQQVQDFLVSKGISSRSDLEDTSSPQYRAAEWIADEDGLNLSMDDVVHFEQRYVVAVMFYDLQGENWVVPLKFLSEESICEWGVGLTATTSRGEEQWRLGVQCNEDKEVNQIFISKWFLFLYRLAT
jgi:hypothetical protein